MIGLTHMATARKSVLLRKSVIIEVIGHIIAWRPHTVRLTLSTETCSFPSVQMMHKTKPICIPCYTSVEASCCMSARNSKLSSAYLVHPLLTNCKMSICFIVSLLSNPNCKDTIYCATCYVLFLLMNVPFFVFYGDSFKTEQSIDSSNDIV